MYELTNKTSDMSSGLWRHRNLILMLARRDIIGRYRGSILGVVWSLMYPLFMLAIYSLVFGGIFKSRWGAGSSSPLEFALILFLGLIVFNLFSESVSRAPGVVAAHASYVNKIVFPLEILPVVLLAGAMFQFLVNLGVWLVFCALLFQIPPLTTLLLPVAILPLLLFTLGACWVLAALGVYLRDIGHLVGVLVTALLFLSPVFYPVTALPERFQHLMALNLLAQVIENVRLVSVWSRLPAPGDWCLSLLLGALVAWLGLRFFLKTRGGFSDVL
ncbi:lipopolysaccharide transport system permease protein [Pseudomonas asplenii]|uniref:Transport permease protein n=2 Tax=Pseudomonas asplenii TaxID=53407 RepID=A0A1H6P047_9PSED|nr:lipopolysaccharide transport system permease protein [Pseudomonas fuscovaginae]